VTGEQPEYPYKTKIIWLEDIGRLDYVRVSADYGFQDPHQPAHFAGPGRLVGYTLHRAGAPCASPNCRRIFWLKDYDRDRDPERVYATTTLFEGVDPRTVRPGYSGFVTERALGEPDYPRGSFEAEYLLKIGRWGP